VRPHRRDVRGGARRGRPDAHRAAPAGASLHDRPDEQPSRGRGRGAAPGDPGGATRSRAASARLCVRAALRARPRPLYAGPIGMEEASPTHWARCIRRDQLDGMRRGLVAAAPAGA
jgi:hypothetical protein